jgi:hypothetical protein
MLRHVVVHLLSPPHGSVLRNHFALHGPGSAAKAEKIEIAPARICQRTPSENSPWLALHKGEENPTVHESRF